MHHVMQVNPATVLDIGIGFGKWGFLCREYLDVANHRYHRKDWKTVIHGCEAFPEYATPLYEYVYDHIYYGDILSFLDELPQYDLAILGDVIEHFPKAVGQQLLNRLVDKCKFVLVSSPTRFFEQELFNNPFEQHQSLWGLGDFAELSFDYDEVEDFLFVVLIDCRASGLVPARVKRASTIAYSTKVLRHRPKLVSLVKSVLKRIVRA